VTQHPLNHGLFDHGEHLLRRGQREGSKASSLAAHQDDSFHYLDPAAVVVVAGAVVDVAGAVVVVAGAVVDVTGAVVDGTVGPLLAAVIKLVIACDGGLGIVVPAGTNAMVINWPLVNRRL